jgi:hypothetical protein
MGMTRKLLPSPALVVALMALFISLGGTAVAAGIVPLAKRALVADKLANGGANALLSRAAQAPGPASSAAGLVTVKSAPWSLAPGTAADFAVMCDSGQKAVAGGFEDPNGYAHSWDSRPTSDGAGWRIFVSVARDASAGQSGTVQAICLK